jgi:hypothetical protein
MMQTEVMSSSRSSITNEKGAPAYDVDQGNQLLLQILPTSSKEEVLEIFEPLYAASPAMAFQLAMMFGNLRPGGGGRPNMNAFVACMEHVWLQNPAHITRNIECIMEDVSCKMMLVLLKHFSNLGDNSSSPNNYWGNLALIQAKKEKSWARNDKPMDEDTILRKKQKRRDRFAAHVRTLQSFMEEKLDQSLFSSIFQIVQPKACVNNSKTYAVEMFGPIARTEGVAAKFDFFCKVIGILDAWEEEIATLNQLEEEGFVSIAVEEIKTDEAIGAKKPASQKEMRKKQRNFERTQWLMHGKKAAKKKLEEMGKLVERFVHYYTDDEELLLSVQKEANSSSSSTAERYVDPIELVSDFAVPKDDCSVASTAENSESEYNDYNDHNDESASMTSSSSSTSQRSNKFFDYGRITVQVPVPGTKASMHPLSGYEVVPWLQADFQQFVADRDQRLAKEASAQRKQRIFVERSSPQRYDQNLCDLYDAVADAFVAFILSPNKNRSDFGFKYCPLPDRSADKATGNLDSKGIGHAVLKRFSVLKGFPMEDASPYSTEFKSWVSTFRRTNGVPESFIGCRQLKQIDLSKAPAMHLRNWGDRIHMRHNPDGFKQFEEDVRRRIEENSAARNNGDDKEKNKNKGVNASNLMPHVLAETLHHASMHPSADVIVAELQLLSIIQKTKVPKDMVILPVVDVSGSMMGTPMQVIFALFLNVFSLSQKTYKYFLFCRWQ